MGDARRAGAAVGEPFLMPTENVLTISGRGSVVTGAVERGALRVGDPVEVVGLGPTVAAVATGLETFGKVLHTAQAGDNAGVLLRGVKREQVGAARWLPRSARRGWPAKPFLANYQPQFFIRTKIEFTPDFQQQNGRTRARWPAMPGLDRRAESLPSAQRRAGQ